MSPRRRLALRALLAGGPAFTIASRAASSNTAADTSLGTFVATSADTTAPSATARSATTDEDDPVRRGRALVFPRDHGAHLGASIEWWYATGWLGTPEAPTHGVQLTFFRSATGLAAGSKSRFAARQLLFAHAALTDLQQRRHLHDQRIARWSGLAGAALGHASVNDGHVALGNWWLKREGSAWRANIDAADFRLVLALQRTQAVLLQGDNGFSRKGPGEQQASHYYSEPQLAMRCELSLSPASGPARSQGTLQGRAWLDHEWSEQLLHPQAVGWDWIGMNLSDGAALTVFVLRRTDGSALWAGGSYRAVGVTEATSFAATQVQMQPQRRWRSPASGASYPVQWRVQCPAGEFTVRALMDEQELDSRQSTGTIYWEGLSELLNRNGLRVGLGYLEMTGYSGPLRLG